MNESWVDEPWAVAVLHAARAPSSCATVAMERACVRLLDAGQAVLDFVLALRQEWEWEFSASIWAACVKNGVLVRTSPLAPLFPLLFALARAAGCTDTRTGHCRPDHASLLLRVPQVLVDGLLLPPALLLLLTGYRAPL